MAAEEEAVEAEDGASVAPMVLIPEENVNLIDTVAVTDRKYFFSSYMVLLMKYSEFTLGLLKAFCVCCHAVYVS